MLFRSVQYNGKYESTPYFQKSIEVILSKKSDFKKWLKQHNEERKKDGDLPEGSDEFDVIPQTLISYE